MRGLRASAIVVIWVVGGLLVRPSAHAQSLDPLAIDKVHYKLEVENQWVRAFRELMAPRETMPMHQHPPKIPLCFSTSRANAGQVDVESGLEARGTVRIPNGHASVAT